MQLMPDNFGSGLGSNGTNGIYDLVLPTNSAREDILPYIDTRLYHLSE
ncbi:MAG: hypothetical protein J6Y81_17520 [Ruminococcus sp.]|nr:hypothetical protein [Ruminococcus sp.]